MKRLFLSFTFALSAFVAFGQVALKNELDAVVAIYSILNNKPSDIELALVNFGFDFQSENYYTDSADGSHTKFLRYTFGPDIDLFCPIEIFVPVYNKRIVALFIDSYILNSQNENYKKAVQLLESLIKNKSLTKSKLFVSDSTLLYYEKSLLEDNR